MASSFRPEAGTVQTAPNRTSSVEALSRGAEHATFVELTAAVVEDLRFNLAKTRLADRATVIHGDAFAFLDRPPTPFDIR